MIDISNKSIRFRNTVYYGILLAALVFGGASGWHIFGEFENHGLGEWIDAAAYGVSASVMFTLFAGYAVKLNKDVEKSDA